jgi:hypothetical protein
MNWNWINYNDLIKKIYICIVLLLFFLCSMSYLSGVSAEDTTLSWYPPATNEDGSPITDLAGYKIHFGTASRIYTWHIDTGKATTYTVTNLAADTTYYFAITAYNTLQKDSKYSNEISRTISSVQKHILSVNKGGTGSGTVTSTSPGISCGSDCTEAYDAGASVTLTAAPDAASVFAGWSGACGGTGSCTVVMDAAKSVSATFTGKTYTIKASAGAGGSISPSGSLKINRTDNQTFTIVPNADFRIDNVVVDGNAIGAVDTYTFMSVEAEHTIHAIFVKKLDSINDEAPYEPPTNEEDVVPAEEAEEAEETEEFFTLPKTGQTISYASGDDGDIQAGVEWPALRFVDNGDGTVTDTLTGLMWLQDGRCFGKRNWKDAFKVITEFNGNPSLYNCAEYSRTYGDWRLPNIRELDSLINYGAPNSCGWLKNSGFTGMQSAFYCTATKYPGKNSFLILDMAAGIQKIAPMKTNSYFLPVRGEASGPYAVPQSGQILSHTPGDDGDNQSGIEWPDPRFVSNGDGTVTDMLTGLMWLKDGSCLGKHKWKDALKTIREFNGNPSLYNCAEYSGTFSDWRMPNSRELDSLINYGYNLSSVWLGTVGFADIKSAFYWSSTSNSTKKMPFAHNFKNGNKIYKSQKSKLNFLPVRSPQ